MTDVQGREPPIDALRETLTRGLWAGNLDGEGRAIRDFALARLPLILASGLMLAAIAELAIAARHGPAYLNPLGVDYRIYMEATARWLDGGAWYLDRQLAGPYPVTSGDVLYPPTVLYLLIPFALGLPALLWWAIPLIAVLWAVWRIDSPWAWVLLAASLAWPRTLAQIGFGNPVIWLWAALWLGTTNGWSAVLGLLKPTAALFALPYARDRRWWVGLVVLAGLSIPFAALWLEYSRVLLDARSPNGWLYSIAEWPMLIAPTVWFVTARVVSRHESDGSGRFCL